MNRMKLTDAVTAGSAMSAEDFAEAAADGFKSIINNRAGTDNNLLITPVQEAALAAQHGLEYRHIPMTSGTISVKAAAEFAKALDELPKPVLAHCGGAARSATLWALSQAPSDLEVQEILATTAGAGFDFSHLTPLLRGLKEDSRREEK
ncbi:beta-lactamase hydrolase-like protein [bacterium MnTg02]|nr:beta-lactamase hydrolase-like protein [bacterium MnTg02]